MVEASCKDNNFFVKVDGVGAFTLFIYPDLVDIQKGINVYVNGKLIIEDEIVNLKNILSENVEVKNNLGLVKIRLENS